MNRFISFDGGTRMATISDVAREARVSVGTVSKVINDRPGVAEATRARVLAAIERLDYHCDSGAKGLRTGRTMMIGVVVTYLDHDYFQRIIAGAESVAYEHGYGVVVCNCQMSPAREREIVKMFFRRQVDGLVMCLPMTGDAELERLSGEGVPMTVVGRPVLGDFRGPVVLADNKSGAYEAVTHFLREHGRRRIAYIHGATDQTDDAARFSGYCQALADAGIAFDPELTGYGGHSDEEKAGEALMRMVYLGHRPDAVFCFDDQVACGVYSAAERLGLRIPGDLAVIGVNDSKVAPYIRPGLTSVALPTYGMGELAAAKLIEILRGGAEGGSGPHVLATGLQTRGSCGCPDHCDVPGSGSGPVVPRP